MASSEPDRRATAERPVLAKFDAMGWGFSFIRIAIALVENFGWGLTLLGLGAVALAVQLVRRVRGRRSAFAASVWAVACSEPASFYGSTPSRAASPFQHGWLQPRSPLLAFRS